jgi:hypothetical protein
VNCYAVAGGSEEVEYKPLPDGQGNDPPKASKVLKVGLPWKMSQDNIVL